MSAAALGDRGLTWLSGDNHDSEIVLSTRVRLARNLQGFAFAARASDDERDRVEERVRLAIESIPELAEALYLDMDGIEPLDREVLLERHLVSRDLIGAPGGTPPSGAGLVLSDRDALGLMVNEEDHLRLQTLLNGLQLEQAWQRVDGLDNELGQLLSYAYHHEFGFLTSCPTNVGTGLRASVLVHLPGLVLTKEINQVLQGISQVGLTFRGFYGEGSEVVGNFFQVSNQTTLGKSEAELIDHLGKIVGKVIEYEKRARSVLLREAPAVLEDKVWRAYGILRHARSLAFAEMMNLLSGVRLGLSLKLIRSVRVETLNRSMIFAQAAHLQRAAGRTLDENETDVRRATYVREQLKRDRAAMDGSDPE